MQQTISVLFCWFFQLALYFMVCEVHSLQPCNRFQVTIQLLSEFKISSFYCDTFRDQFKRKIWRKTLTPTDRKRKTVILVFLGSFFIDDIMRGGTPSFSLCVFQNEANWLEAKLKNLKVQFPSWRLHNDVGRNIKEWWKHILTKIKLKNIKKIQLSLSGKPHGVIYSQDTNRNNSEIMKLLFWLLQKRPREMIRKQILNVINFNLHVIEH